MSALESLILGIFQGLTEFLPVSSSGHLELLKAIFGNDYGGEQSLIITVTLHSATALSTIFVFRKDIQLILSDLFCFFYSTVRSLIVNLCLATDPPCRAAIAIDLARKWLAAAPHACMM